MQIGVALQFSKKRIHAHGLIIKSNKLCNRPTADWKVNDKMSPTWNFVDRSRLQCVRFVVFCSETFLVVPPLLFSPQFQTKLFRPTRMEPKRETWTGEVTRGKFSVTFFMSLQFAFIVIMKTSWKFEARSDGRTGEKNG